MRMRAYGTRWDKGRRRIHLLQSKYSMAITKSKVQQWVESTNCEVLYYTGVMTDNTDKDGYWYKYQNHRKPDYETRV